MIHALALLALVVMYASLYLCVAFGALGLVPFALGAALLLWVAQNNG